MATTRAPNVQITGATTLEDGDKPAVVTPIPLSWLVVGRNVQEEIGRQHKAALALRNAGKPYSKRVRITVDIQVA